MYELVKLTEHDYYIECPARIGLVLIGEGRAVLIDSGSDKDAGKKLFRILEAQGLQLAAIYNTHSHADHIGGNRFLQEKTGCPAYARGMERTYAETPLLEPVGLYGGQPFKDLRHKFLMAQESAVQPLTEDILPAGFKLLELPGHSFDMVGFMTPDGTAYIADSVSSEATLAKYGIGYLWDTAASLETLEKLPEIAAARFVPAHAPVTENIRPLAEINRQAILAVQEKVLSFCRTPQTFEQLLKQIFDAYGLVMPAQQYALIGSTLRSYLTGLYAEGRIGFFFEKNEMLWSAH